MGAYSVKDKAEVQAGIERAYTMFPRLKERSGQVAGTLSGGEHTRPCGCLRPGALDARGSVVAPSGVLVSAGVTGRRSPEGCGRGRVTVRDRAGVRHGSCRPAIFMPREQHQHSTGPRRRPTRSVASGRLSTGRHHARPGRCETCDPSAPRHGRVSATPGSPGDHPRRSRHVKFRGQRLPGGPGSRPLPGSPRGATRPTAPRGPRRPTAPRGPRRPTAPRRPPAARTAASFGADGGFMPGAAASSAAASRSPQSRQARDDRSCRTPSPRRRIASPPARRQHAHAAPSAQVRANWPRGTP